MPMTIDTAGLDEVSRILAQLGARAQDVASAALYDGAGVVADAFTAATGQIRTEPFKGKRDHRLPSPEEAAAVKGKTGIATFKKNGSEVNTLIGVQPNAGYVMLGKRKTAVQEIARSINSGTSFMSKQPVFRRAVSSSKAAAMAATVAKAEEKLNEIIGG